MCYNTTHSERISNIFTKLFWLEYWKILNIFNLQRNETLIILAPLIYWIAYVWLTVDSFSSYFICSFKFFASNSSNRLFAFNWILTLFIPLSITSQFYLKVSNRLRFLKISHVASTVHHLSCDSRLSRRSRDQDEIPHVTVLLSCAYMRERLTRLHYLFVSERHALHRAAPRRSARNAKQSASIISLRLETQCRSVARYRVDGLRNLTV